MKYYLVYDGGCSVCNQIGQGIKDIGEDKIEAISVHSVHARTLLDSAYPAGWAYAPYYLKVDERGEVHAFSGLPAVLRLAWRLGPRRSLRTWLLARSWGISVREVAAPRGVKSPSRRGLLKLAAAAGVATGIFALRPAVPALACACDVDCPCPAWDSRFAFSICYYQCHQNPNVPELDYVYYDYSCGSLCGLLQYEICCSPGCC